MEKKFKNGSFKVKGRTSLLEALTKELQAIGYEEHPNTRSNILFVYPQGHSQKTNPCFSYVIGLWETDYTLPQDWEKVLEIASEVKEEVPEYVKCVKGNAKKSGEPGYIPGKIYATEKEQPSFPDQLYIKCENGRILKVHNWANGSVSKFELSTKEAYEAQQNVPKYKVGDFLLHNDQTPNIRFIKEVKEDRYIINVYHTKDDYSTYSWDPLIKDIDGSHYKISDIEALRLLELHYAQKGIVVGAKITWGTGVSTFIVKGFSLRKDEKLLKGVDHGDSPLVIFSENAYTTATVTPTTENFRLPKEVKVAGYETEIFLVGAPKTVKIGCKYYTRDSLITIRDLIIHSIQGGGKTSAYFRLEGVGLTHVTVDELNEAIKLFDNV